MQPSCHECNDERSSLTTRPAGWTCQPTSQRTSQQSTKWRKRQSGPVHLGPPPFWRTKRLGFRWLQI
ncbi:hypothetical protein CC2G_013956 [Coprinopsis cinerea AmutBmut pab1-1]|nr:hypothetical protein CC2G_013956 [Coprinopsis cinerea AmutBmut pab1-1]